MTEASETLSVEVVSAAEVWAAGVLKIRSELGLSLAGAPDAWGGDDLVGVYTSRESLARTIAHAGLTQPPGVVAAADELLRTFSEMAGRGWLDNLGHKGGDGWWWSLVPREGPVREDLARYGFRDSEHPT